MEQESLSVSSGSEAGGASHSPAVSHEGGQHLCPFAGEGEAGLTPPLLL